MRQFSDDEALTPAAFALVITEIFFGEPWGDIEPYAARAWSQLPAEQSWEDVSGSVRSLFERLGS